MNNESNQVINDKKKPQKTTGERNKRPQKKANALISPKDWSANDALIFSL